MTFAVFVAAIIGVPLVLTIGAWIAVEVVRLLS